MQLQSYQEKWNHGHSWIADRVKYTVEEPYGFIQNANYRLYRKGALVRNLPESFLEMPGANGSIRPTDVYLPYNGMYIFSHEETNGFMMEE